MQDNSSKLENCVEQISSRPRLQVKAKDGLFEAKVRSVWGQGRQNLLRDVSSS